MTAWDCIENQTHLDQIVVTVLQAEHCDAEKLAWRLRLEDRTGKQFDLDIWQTHDSLVEWEVGATYEIRGAYGQTWADGTKRKLHSSKTWSADRVDTVYDVRLAVMGDSHIGRQTHPSKPSQSIDCAGKFRQAIEIAVTNDADHVIHTGDVFHDNITERECDVVEAAFEQLSDARVTFHYILGNHECDRGQELLRDWTRRGVANHLTMDGATVADGIRVYGYDHIPESQFSLAEMGVPSTAGDEVSILVLHQTLAPFRNGNVVNLNRINHRAGRGFDYVISGHLHDPEWPEWEHGEFLYAGPTEDISTNPSPSDPSVWILTIHDGSIARDRRKL
jgi:predicted phosphodiesterase